jgi:hypothetical protein
MFQLKHSCFWCSLISVSIGQHVSTLFFIAGSSSGLSFFFLYVGIFLPSAMLHIAGAYFCLHMVKIDSYG